MELAKLKADIQQELKAAAQDRETARKEREDTQKEKLEIQTMLLDIRKMMQQIITTQARSTLTSPPHSPEQIKRTRDTTSMEVTTHSGKKHDAKDTPTRSLYDTHE